MTGEWIRLTERSEVDDPVHVRASAIQMIVPHPGGSGSRLLVGGLIIDVRESVEDVQRLIGIKS